MRPLVNEEINDDYTRYLFFSEIDNDAIENARGAFKDYKSRGVIMTGDFEDDEWIMNNELKKFHFHFKLDGRKYSAGAGRWCGISSQKYKICLKTYVVMRLGDIVLSHLKEICKDILEMAYQQMEDIYSARNGVHLNEFINSLPGYSEDRERVIERLEEDLSRRQWKKRDSRKLEGFSSYLKFDAGLTEFWDKADKEQKIMYFPVYFWWKLTVILPLRPTEFILTPVNCIRKADDRCFIYVRRTKNKKNSSKKKYTVTDDYEICEYEIPTYLYDDIATYIEMTAAMRSEENRMLLLPSEDAHTWYMTYQQMNYRLHRFIEKELISNDLIINLGDTRHLAMINLMLSGGSPVICRELAGHEDIDISSNYYSNLSTIVESAVYEYCHSGDQAAIFDGNLYFPVRMPENKVRVQEDTVIIFR